jgi:hypothetical protein
LYNLHNEKQAQSKWKKKFIVVTQVATMEQLKDLTHMFYL